MKQLEYKTIWKDPQIIKADAEKVGKELFKVQSKFGEASPKNVLSYAETNLKSELYKCFEWDDSIAAQKHRLTQARYVITHIQLVTTDEQPIRMRLWEPVVIEKDKKEQMKWVNVAEAINDKRQRESLLDNINKLLDQAKDKLSNYNRLINYIIENKKST